MIRNLNKDELEALLHTIADLQLDSIHEHNPNGGADWHTCRLCNASKPEIRGVYQTIEHYQDCPGTIARKMLDELDSENENE